MLDATNLTQRDSRNGARIAAFAPRFVGAPSLTGLDGSPKAHADQHRKETDIQPNPNHSPKTGSGLHPRHQAPEVS